MYEQLEDTIQRLIHLKSDEKLLLKQLFVPKHLGKGEYFLRAGEPCQHVAFIQQGLLRYYLHGDGEEFTYFFAKEQNFISDYESLLSSQPSTKSIQALEDCLLLVTTYENFQLIYKQVEEGERLGRLLIETVFVKIVQQLTSLYQDSPEERYKKFLENFSDIQQRIPQYYIASYVGVKPQSLSRIRRRIGI